MRGRASARPAENVRDNREIGVASSGIGGMPKNCSGYCTRRKLGVQLELGAAAPAFGIETSCQRGMQNNCSGSGHCSGLASGHTGVFTRIFPGSISCRPAELRARALPGELTRTIVRLPDRTGHGPAVPARRPAWIKKFILGVDIIYSLG